MLYQSYINREHEVEAGKFDSSDFIGDIVQNLYDAGCGHITLSSTPNNPQLEETSYMVSISFVQNGVLQVLFIGDILSFDEDDNAIVWNEEDFLNNYEVVNSENGG